MESFSTIHAVLARVRHRLRRQAGAAAALYCLATALVAAVGVPLAAASVTPARAPSVAGIALGVATTAAAAALVWWTLQLRSWRSREAVARLVGHRAPELASDLMSSVQLEPAASGGGGTSAALIHALAKTTADRLVALDLARIVPRERARPAVLALAGATSAVAVVVSVLPATLARGVAHLAAAHEGLVAGALPSDLPVVGDIRITLAYPPYTGREPVQLPASSGDFRAMPGTVATLETTALEPLSGAALLVGRDADDARPMALAGEQLTVKLEVSRATVYRFLITPTGAPPRVETAAHAIEIEPDTVPEVELYAPADELAVEGRRRVELAYTTEDDYGVTALALVWDSEGGGEPGRLELPPPSVGGRTAQGKFLWDLAEVSLPAGARIGYHLEVTDNDTVSGPKTGRSRTYYLKMFSPRERHEDLMARQRELFEGLVRMLGGRMLVVADDAGTHEELNKLARRAVVEIGGIVADLGEDKLAAPELVTAFRAMKERLEKLADAESKLLAAGAPGRKLAASDKKHVAQHENDVLALADWLDRQQAENLLTITDEIRERRQRLDSLFAEHERTGSAETLAEIERELRALKQRMAELAQQQGMVSDDVLDQFMNSDAIESDDAQNCLDQVRELMKAGKVAEAREQMQRCGELFDETSQSLEDMLSQLRGDRFPEQERKLGELMGELADLAQDERDIAAAADELMQRYAESAAEMMKDKAKEFREQAGAIVDKLRARIDRVPRQGLTPFSSEELPVVESRVADVERMLDDGDLAEALAMARQAELGLETMDAELGAELDSGQPWNDRTGDAYNQVNRALRLARELVELLERSTPSPQEIMSPEDRRQMRQLQRRQQRARERAQRLADKAEQQNVELPGNAGQVMAEGLREAEAPMGRAEERMKAGDPSGSRQEARDAADRLQRAQEQAKGATRQQQMGGRGTREEPVRIPGADEYRAPEAFREEILDAMKKQAPNGFAEQVKRYYEDLIR